MMYMIFKMFESKWYSFTNGYILLLPKSHIFTLCTKFLQNTLALFRKSHHAVQVGFNSSLPQSLGTVNITFVPFSYLIPYRFSHFAFRISLLAGILT